jgi:hypothetical protein
MILLAQTTGSDFSAFMEQPFVGPVLGMVCVFGFLLIAVVATLVYLRRRKALSAPVIPTPSFAGDTGNNHDMPDLDLLVNTVGLAQPAAPVVPVSTPTRTVRKGTFVVAVNDGDATEAVEVMVILRDLVDGKLIVQMGDKAYQSVNNDADFKDRFNKVMRELAQVVKPVGAAVPAPAQPADLSGDDSSAAVEEVEPSTPSLADLMQPTTPAEPPKPRVSAPPPPPPSGVMPGDLPSFKLDDNPYERPKRGQKKEVKPVPEVNIAGAIEAYLQYKLRNTPDYQGHSIHIYPSPDGGVSIEVEGRYYDAVGDIEDTEIREFIAGAIQEWQDRH